MIIITVLFLCGTIHQISTNDLQNTGSEFNVKHTGVVFAPYVKNYNPDGTIAKWNNYTFQEVYQLINWTSTKFHHASTYGMGAIDANSSWQEGNAVGFSAVAAAEFNLKSSAHKIALSLGIWHNKDPGIQFREIQNAFAAGNEANQIYPKTVWGIALSSFAWMDYRTWGNVIEFLTEYRNTSNQYNLKLGVRLETCDQVIPRLRPEEESKNNLHGTRPSQMADATPLTDIQKIARLADFLICTTFPTASMASAGVESTVKALESLMTASVKGLKAENPKIDIWFETGWPSAGISRFGSKNTGRNLRTFWKGMSEMAVIAGLQLYMLEAFDEPWKAHTNKDATDPEGPNGAESHFGWWRLRDNNDFSSFEEKVEEPEPTGGLGAGGIVGILLAIVLPIILFLVWRLYKARQTIEKLSEQDIKEFMEGIPGKGNGDSVDAALQLPYDHSYELSKNQFVVDESDILGSGAFGVVHKGRINGIDGSVAFKRPNKDISVSQLKNLLSEIKIMIYIGKHENVVVLLGAYTAQIKEGIVYIASECCPLGSLESHLRNIPRTFTSYANVSFVNETTEASPDDRYVNLGRKTVENSTTIPIGSLYNWSYQIANGMEYLGGKKVIHADLATRNILLTQDGIAKITDFGLSRRLYEYTQYVKSSQEPLPWRWMAIESLRNLSFSSMSDVWSYGVTIWEIFSLGDLPYPGLSWNVTFVDELERGLRMQMPKYATPEIYEKMVMCWHLDPQMRCSFTELKEFFQLLATQEAKLGS